MKTNLWKFYEQTFEITQKNNNSNNTLNSLHDVTNSAQVHRYHYCVLRSKSFTFPLDALQPSWQQTRISYSMGNDEIFVIFFGVLVLRLGACQSLWWCKVFFRQSPSMAASGLMSEGHLRLYTIKVRLRRYIHLHAEQLVCGLRA